MKKILFGLVVIIFIFLSLFSYVVYMEFVKNECGLEPEQAKNRVERYLKQNNLPLDYLSKPKNQSGTCSYSFMYESSEKKINFVVLSTWLHGVKLTYWDYSLQK